MCGIVGIKSEKENVCLSIYNALTVLQHRGQDAAGMAVSDSNGFKKVMLSQSYMPAQENHILINPLNNGVWFKISSSTKVIKTPEYTFYSNELRRFIN